MDFKQASELRYNTQPIDTFAKPMVYTKERIGDKRGEVIAQGTYQGLNYYVKSLRGSHPTAYIEIPQGHKAYGKDFNEYERELIDVHGGVTYQSGKLPPVDDKGERGHKFVGWDYMHYCDFCGIYIGDTHFEKHNKRWATEEIVEECKNAIEQINALE